MRKSGCVSCHNNTLTYMTLATAHEKGIAVNDQIVAKELKTITSYLESWRERVLQGVGIPGDSDTISAILVGLADARVPPDPATDALANYLKNHQAPDGRWFIVAHRPPLESSVRRKYPWLQKRNPLSNGTLSSSTRSTIKLNLENDRVRIVRIRYAGREKSVMHQHPPGVGIFLTDANFKFSYPDGKTENIKAKAGEYLWFGEVWEHLPENSSDKNAEVIYVELKS